MNSLATWRRTSALPVEGSTAEAHPSRRQAVGLALPPLRSKTNQPYEWTLQDGQVDLTLRDTYSANRGLNASLESMCALAIVCVAFLGLCANYAVAFSRSNSHIHSLFTMIYYFTNTTAILVLSVFLGILLNREFWLRSWVVAGASLSVLLVGIVQYVFRASGPPLHGLEFAQDFLLHGILPIAVPIFWMSFVTKGQLRLRYAFIWAAYPLVYDVLILIHGAITGLYPYIFVDVTQTGLVRVLITAGVIATCFLFGGCLWVGVDSYLGRRGHAR